MIRTVPRRAPALVLALGLAIVVSTGCAPKQEEGSTVGAPAESTTTAARTDTAALNTMPVKPATPPEHVVVQHILIGFQGTVPGKTVTRTKDEAEKLAADLLARARKGENFDSLVQQYTDDQFPGVYALANTGATPDAAKGEFARGQMVKGFGDVAFELSVGNIDVAPYDAKTSPFGWHIIKRVE